MAAYYGDDVKHPKRTGELAIQTKHKTESSLYLDVLAANDREDIGRVDWWGPISEHTLKLLQNV